MKPDFSKINFKQVWEKAHESHAQPTEWQTAEQIPLKSFYTENDTISFEHLDYAAGIAPFLRGPYSTMYVRNPGSIRQYAGFQQLKKVTHFTVEI